ncbi:MAG: DUF3616 domain-containing protein [Dokdonella sp.]
MIAIGKRLPGWLGACALALCALPAAAQMRITEYMYGGANGEFVEFTNVGSAAVDMTGWSFDDSSRIPGSQDLSVYGTVAPGESVIFTETNADTFRTAWSLCAAVKVIGGNTNNLGRDDEINLYDASGQQVDRLTYGDDTALGGVRTNGFSGWVNAAGLGNNIATDWTLSIVGDAEGSYASSGGDIGSPGKSTRATVAFDACQPPVGVMRISEYMYGGVNGEFVEFTNVGNAPVDMTGWSFDDSSRTPGSQDLSAYGAVAPGESVVFTETAADLFRTDWSLCSGIKIIGGNTNNLGRDDEINLYDANDQLIDRLTYGDDTALGGVRTNNISGWVGAAGLGSNVAADWTLSIVGDAEGSTASLGHDVGSPGKSTRATVAFDPCVGAPDAPTITVDDSATSLYLDLAATTAGAASGVIDDPTDPAATTGIGFTFAVSGGGDASTLTISAASSNPDVVDASGLALSGAGAARQLTITPHGVGYATITVSATDADNNTGTYAISYAASAAAAQPSTTRFHTGASDASATIAVDADTMLVADDETNILRLYSRHQSGLPLAGFDFTSQLNLTDPDNPEMDLEGSTRIDNHLFWTGSYSNSKNFHVRPNRHRVFATDLSGSGANAALAYVGRYDWLLEDLVAWDQNNGHGLGANALGFAASSAEGVDSKTPAGFNIEGLSIAPDGGTAYFAFRAPLLPTNDRHQALIVPVLDFQALVGTADSQPQGSATFGAPIFLDLGGRGIRSLDRNASGQFLITAGPTGDATGIAPSDFRLYAWTGNPADAPLELGVDLTALDVNGGSFESIAELPDPLGVGTVLQFLLDNGDSAWYGDGIAAKDLTESRFKKATSLEVSVDIVYPATSVVASSGTPQNTGVSQPFAAQLGVLVKDAYGQAVSGVNVGFAAPSDGASAVLSSTSAITDSKGLASVSATANAIAGGYGVVASIGGVGKTASFALTNTPGAAALLTATSGSGQSVVVRQAFATPLVVHVTDVAGNAVPNALVTFSAPQGGPGALLSQGDVTTDANGDAEVEATANPSAGSYVVTALVDGAKAPALYTLTNTPGPASLVTAIGGTPQSTVVGQPFAAPLTLQVTDADGNATAGVTVTFAVPAKEASATLSSMTATIDATGVASVTATANAVAGSYQVTATIDGGVTTALFDLTNTIDVTDVIFRNGFELATP